MKPVWIVDDDRSIRWVIEKALSREGIAFSSFSTAKEALDALDGSAPEVLVSDVRMPGMSGLELLPAMRALDGCEDLPAIFLSGRVEEHDIEAGRALDATYLTKPFSANALKNAIARLTPVEVGW
jgi:two-component system, NtrC family, nitrogen regulation response regulator GlnG